MDNTLIILWIICGFFGWWIGSTKGRPVAGALLGFLLGLIGIVIIALIPKTIEKRAEDEARIRAILGDNRRM